jgi:predicted metal-dependent phosphotriesterase family hydrolase
VVAHDHACYGDFLPEEFRKMDSYRKTFFTDAIVPQLLARGVTAEQISMLTTENPRRIFEGAS